MTMDLEVLKRIVRDGVGLNRDTLNEMVLEIETLRARVSDLENEVDLFKPAVCEDRHDR